MKKNIEKWIVEAAQLAYIVGKVADADPQDGASGMCRFCFRQLPLYGSLPLNHTEECAWRQAKEFAGE